jgi:hypothetical protein
MRAPSVGALALEVALFQGAWLAAVLGTVAGWSCSAPIAVAVYLLFQLTRVGPACHVRLATAALSFGVAGFAIDSLLSAGGLLGFTGRPPGATAPLWMAALWAQLAGSAPALSRIAGRPVLAAALGAIAGPLAYRAGVALGAIELRTGDWTALATLALVWALALPAVAAVCRRVVAPSGRGEASLGEGDAWAL